MQVSTSRRARTPNKARHSSTPWREVVFTTRVPTSILLLLLQNTNINIEDGMATSFLGHTGMVCSLVAGGDSLGYFIECAHEQDQICP